jgi:transcriptional regulator with XRE-family HTH domain
LEVVPRRSYVQPFSGTKKEFGVVLRNLRKERGLTQSALALRSGVTRVYIGFVECGLRSPTVPTLEQLAAGLGLQGSELLQCLEASRKKPPT